MTLHNKFHTFTQLEYEVERVPNFVDPLESVWLSSTETCSPHPTPLIQALDFFRSRSGPRAYANTDEPLGARVLGSDYFR